MEGLEGDSLDNDNECVISVKELTKIYGSVKAVDRVSFCVKDREIFGFLGPNGAGKTTTVRMLVGLTTISSGNALVYGYNVVKDYKNVRKIIGVVPDVSNLYLELTCFQNLLFSAKMYDVPKGMREERINYLLKFFGLWKFRNVKFKNLSRGLKRRLTIAAALVHKPKVLFLDEPTSGLDVMSRRILWTQLKELNRQEVTIFLTTHNVYEAFHISDRIAIINKGRIVAIGSPKELSKRFSTQEVIEVAFYPSKMSTKDLSEHIKGMLSVKRVGNHFEIVPLNKNSVIEGIVRYAKSRGLEISMLRLRSADAEELFLKIVGETK